MITKTDYLVTVHVAHGDGSFALAEHVLPDTSYELLNACVTNAPMIPSRCAAAHWLNVNERCEYDTSKVEAVYVTRRIHLSETIKTFRE